MNKHSGSNFDDFLEKEGILEEVSALARNRLEKPDNTSGLISRFLQSLQFNNQFVLQAVGVVHCCWSLSRESLFRQRCIRYSWHST